MKKYLFVLISVFIISGCSTPHWAKQGASEYDTSSAKAECNSESYEKYPANVKTSVDFDLGALMRDNYSDALGVHDNDVNEDARYAFFKNCMYKKGWMIVSD